MSENQQKEAKLSKKSDLKVSIISLILGILFIFGTILGTVYFSFPDLFKSQEEVVFEPEVIYSNEVNVYLFVDKECIFCQEAKTFLESKVAEDEKIKLYIFDVTQGNPDQEKNSALLEEVSKTINEPVLGMPYTVIGDLIYGGFGEGTGENMMKRINYCIESEYCNDSISDVVGAEKAKEDIKD